MVSAASAGNLSGADEREVHPCGRQRVPGRNHRLSSTQPIRTTRVRAGALAEWAAKVHAGGTLLISAARNTTPVAWGGLGGWTYRTIPLRTLSRSSRPDHESMIMAQGARRLRSSNTALARFDRNRAREGVVGAPSGRSAHASRVTKGTAPPWQSGIIPEDGTDRKRSGRSQAPEPTTTGSKRAGVFASVVATSTVGSAAPVGC